MGIWAVILTEYSWVSDSGKKSRLRLDKKIQGNSKKKRWQNQLGFVHETFDF
jgi:hypothetical protein